MKAYVLACLVVTASLLPGPVSAFWGPVGGGMDSDVYSLLHYDGELIAGGAFTHADGAPANFIARWNGASWEPVGTGVGGVYEPRVFALAIFNGDLIAAGHFLEAGGLPASNIARWDGMSWTPLGSGLDDTAYALTLFGGRLIVGGSFAHAGGTLVNCIAQWDGSSWSGIGGGLQCFACGNTAAVVSLSVHGSDSLIAGGWFDYAGDANANYIASWSGSSESWRALGSGMDFPVSTLIDYQGDLVAGGAFSQAGGQTATGIARWDGIAWHPLGDGVVGWYNWVRALAIYNGNLIAGGYFTLAGGQPANHIARWNGSSWSTLGDGTDASVVSLLVSDSMLVVGGSFDQAGGTPAHKIAYWQDDAPMGACCLNSFCTVMTRSECVQYQGSYQGDGTFCDPNPCPTSSADGSDWAPGAVWLSAMPNPNEGLVNLQYQLPKATVARIDVFDARGVLLRSFQDRLQPAGRHLLAWDGRTEVGRDLPSGFYIARITSDSGTATARLVLAR